MLERVLILVCLLCLPGLGAEKAALLARLNGEVTVQEPGGKPVEARTGQQLAVGTVVTVKSGEVSIIFLRNAQQETLRGQGSLTLGMEGSTTHTGDLQIKAGPGQMPSPPKGNTAQAGLGVMRPAVHKFHKAVFGADGSLVVHWESSEVMKSFEITIVDGTGKTLLKEEVPVGSPQLQETKDGHHELRVGPGFEQDRLYTMRIFGDQDTSPTLFAFAHNSPARQTSLKGIRDWARQAEPDDPSAYVFLANFALECAELDLALQAGLEADKRAQGQDIGIRSLLYEIYCLKGDRPSAASILASIKEKVKLDADGRIIWP